MALQWAFDQADRDGLDCYLEATPAGYPMYKKCGFMPQGGFVMNNSDYVLLSMLRKPGGDVEWAKDTVFIGQK
jgi:hypothetical protein